MKAQYVRHVAEIQLSSEVVDLDIISIYSGLQTQLNKVQDILGIEISQFKKVMDHNKPNGILDFIKRQLVVGKVQKGLATNLLHTSLGWVSQQEENPNHIPNKIEFVFTVGVNKDNIATGYIFTEVTLNRDNMKKSAEMLRTLKDGGWFKYNSDETVKVTRQHSERSLCPTQEIWQTDEEWVQDLIKGTDYEYVLEHIADIKLDGIDFMSREDKIQYAIKEAIRQVRQNMIKDYDYVETPEYREAYGRVFHNRITSYLQGMALVHQSKIKSKKENGSSK